MTPFSTMLLSATTARSITFLDLRYPRLDEGQFVLGFLVFGVIDASSGIVGRSDLRGNLPTAHVLKVRQLFFELLHALGSEVLRVSVHR